MQKMNKTRNCFVCTIKKESHFICEIEDEMKKRADTKTHFSETSGEIESLVEVFNQMRVDSVALRTEESINNDRESNKKCTQRTNGI